MSDVIVQSHRKVRIAPWQEFFCDGNPGDCKDGSDETACTVDEDPNAAPKCDLSQCVLPDCFCSADGTKIPGKKRRSISASSIIPTPSPNKRREAISREV